MVNPGERAEASDKRFFPPRTVLNAFPGKRMWEINISFPSSSDQLEIVKQVSGWRRADIEKKVGKLIR
jgi:hypothetical protein